MVQAIMDQFWRIWQKLYFPSLLIQQKWHTEIRNLQIGVVCLLRDLNNVRGNWRLCHVTATYPDDQGQVRNVEVKVVPSQTGSPSYSPGKPNFLKRHVASLIVLVPAEEQ